MDRKLRTILAFVVFSIMFLLVITFSYSKVCITDCCEFPDCCDYPCEEEEPDVGCGGDWDCPAGQTCDGGSCIPIEGPDEPEPDEPEPDKPEPDEPEPDCVNAWECPSNHTYDGCNCIPPEPDEPEPSCIPGCGDPPGDYCEGACPEPETCTPSCSCDGKKKVCIDEACNESREHCEHGCKDGECKGGGMEVEQTCTPGWKCLPGKENWRAYQKEDCSWHNEEYCPNGCSNGECVCAPLGCSHYQGQCGSFPDGCGRTIQCGCPSGFECVDGECVCAPKTRCSAGSECGTESDGCGGTINCGSCGEGFVCDSHWRKCVLKPEPRELELSNIQVFAYATYAVVSWQSSVEADSRVEFGESEALGESVYDEARSKEHRVVLTGLEPETQYYYRVSSKDGIVKQSEVLSFRTKKAGEEELKVLLIAVSPASRIQYEGQSFSFTAVTNALDSSKLEFDWDFGDGSNGSGERVFHSYYGLGLKREKEFTVRVKVADRNGREAEGSVTVKVLKAVFKPLVLEPREFVVYSKDADLNVLIAFLDEEEELIECKEIGLRVVFAGKVIEMECEGNNSFAGVLNAWSGLKEMELLEISAEFEREGKKHYVKTRIPVYFGGALIEVTDAFKGKKYYLSEEIEEEKVRFLLDEIFIVTPEELKAELVSGAREEEVRVEREEEGFDYVIFFEHRVSESDLLNGLELRLLGSDSKGNRIDEVQRVPIEGENPALTIAVLEPLEDERTFAFGQALNIRAKILSNNVMVSDKRLFLECSELGLFEEMELDMLWNEYRVEIVLPGADSGKSRLKCRLLAYGTLNRKELADFESVEVSLSNSLLIEFVVPAQEKAMVFGNELGEIRVRLLQPNGRLFRQEELNAELSVDGSVQSVALEFDERKGLHKAQLASPIPLGAHSIELTLAGEFQGSKAIHTTIEQDVFLFNLATTVLVVAGVLFLLFFLALLLKNVFSERRLLVEQRGHLLGLRKKYEYEYYKRHITESELSARMRELEQGMKGINRLLKRGSWVKVGFFKTIFRSKNPKKLPERVQAAFLVIRLAGKRGEFSMGEVAMVMREEKCSESVISSVLEELYK